jgi:hypothetical protein
MSVDHQESAKVSRTFRRFHAHGLIAKVPRTRRWRVTTDAALWELRSISGTTTSRRRIPESPHDPLCQMQRSYGERLYNHPMPGERGSAHFRTLVRVVTLQRISAANVAILERGG